MNDVLARAIYQLQAGNAETAKALLSDEIKKQPDSGDALHYLGLAEYQLGNIGRGLELLKQSVRMTPDQVSFLDNLSLALQQQGDAQAAAAYLHRALSLNPRLPQLWIRLGELFVQIRRYLKADQCFDNALQIQPDAAAAIKGKTASLRAQLRNAEALLFLEQRLPVVTADSGLLHEYCDLLILSGQTESAIRLLQAELGRGGGGTEACYLLGLAYGSAGNFAKADDYLLESIQGELPYTPALVRLAATRKFTADDPLIAKMQAILTASAGDTFDAANAHFALGKACNDMYLFDAAFNHYQEGNRLLHGLRPFSSRQHAQYIAETMRFFDKARLDSVPPLPAASTNVTPIFVLGMPRSGTTVTEQMIATHPDVMAGGELPTLTYELVRAVGAQNMRNPRAMAQLSSEKLLQVRDGYLEYLGRIANGKRLVTDKLPGNFMRIGLLHMLFPTAPIIHCQRDPMDNCLSCYFTLFGQGQEYSYDLGSLADYYKAYLLIMQHWKKVMPAGSILDVPYENLVQDPDQWMPAVFRHCGLGVPAGYREFYKTARPVRTASVYQVRQPLYRSSIGRWHNYERQLVELHAALYA